jgi:hypothetical protein
MNENILSSEYKLFLLPTCATALSVLFIKLNCSNTDTSYIQNSCICISRIVLQ